MPIYRILPDRLNFLQLFISGDKVRQSLCKDCRFHFDPSPIKYSDIWHTLEIEFYDSSNNSTKKESPDISVGNGKMFLSENAYKVLSELLKSHGEFLPVNYSDRRGFMFNSLSSADELNALDTELCVRNEWDEMEHIGFVEERLKDTPLFRTAFESYMGHFCTDEFKTLVEENHLKGITFSIDVSNIFPPDPSSCTPTKH